MANINYQKDAKLTSSELSKVIPDIDAFHKFLLSELSSIMKINTPYAKEIAKVFKADNTSLVLRVKISRKTFKDLVFSYTMTTSNAVTLFNWSDSYTVFNNLNTDIVQVISTLKSI